MKFTKNNQELKTKFYTGQDIIVPHVQAGETRFVVSTTDTIDIVHALKVSGTQYGTYETYTNQSGVDPAVTYQFSGNGDLAITVLTVVTDQFSTTYTPTTYNETWFNGTPAAYPYTISLSGGGSVTMTSPSSSGTLSTSAASVTLTHTFTTSASSGTAQFTVRVIYYNNTVA